MKGARCFAIEIGSRRLVLHLTEQYASRFAHAFHEEHHSFRRVWINVPAFAFRKTILR